MNPEQRKAVETLKGPLLVLAGAGTGKTRVITYRIANLLRHDVDPQCVVGLTFTNKAAREMRTRVDELVGRGEARKIFLGTFHSFCLMTLKKETKHAGLLPGFTIADDEDQSSVLKQAIAEVSGGTTGIGADFYRSAISRAKNELKTPDDLRRSSESGFDTTAADVYDRYQKLLWTQNMVDFDDMLMKVVAMWDENPELLRKYQEIYQHLLVDEFQDTNHAQLRLVTLLAGDRCNICVVGDDDQSIYGWRGAKVENILEFPSLFPGTTVVKLEQNYRSTNTILKAANAFIAGNEKRHDKSLWSERGEGELIVRRELPADLEEAAFVAESVHEVKYRETSLRYSDIAVLFRSNHQSRLFEAAFRKEGIPYRLVGAKSFYERREVRDAAAYLKLLVNPRDDQSFLRILSSPPRGIGEKAVEDLRRIQAEKSQPLVELLGGQDFQAAAKGKAAAGGAELAGCVKRWRAEFTLPGDLARKAKNYFKELGFLDGFQKMYRNIKEADERRENVIEFVNAMGQFEDGSEEAPTLAEFLEKFILADDNDKVDKSEDGTENAVTLSTIHAAKGLEFFCVFLVGLEQNVFPHHRALEERSLDEERRLFYVALTRARNLLYLTNCRVRRSYGSLAYQQPSVFIAEIPEELLELPGMGGPVDDDSVDTAFSDFYNKFSVND